MDVNRPPFRARVLASISNIFQERQIIFRSAGTIRHFNLSRSTQITALCVWVALTSWVGFATVGVSLQTQTIAEKDAIIARSETAYRRLLDQVSDYQLSVVSITRDLKESQAHLVRLFEQNEALQTDLNLTENQLHLTKVERDRIINGRRALTNQFDLLGREVRRMSSKNNGLESNIRTLRAHLESVEAQKAEIAAERAALDNRLWQMQNELQSSIAKRETLEDTIQSLRSNLRNAVIERSTVAAENDSLRAEMNSVRTALESVEDRHRARLEDISERALVNVRRFEDVLRRTGLKLEEIIPMPNGAIMGQGGPFIPYHPDMKVEEDVDALEFDLEIRLERWRQLSSLIGSVPLIAPLDQYYLSSRFGRRKDPINGRWAMHRGVDLAAHYKSPVSATAPGTVTYAGRMSRYGRLVEIDHGHGLVTRYAHLAKVLVKKGQTVKIGDKIGLLGSSGRSTGPHVHYEVRYKGRPLNPRKFLKAGQYVQQKRS